MPKKRNYFKLDPTPCNADKKIKNCSQSDLFFAIFNNIKKKCYLLKVIDSIDYLTYIRHLIKTSSNHYRLYLNINDFNLYLSNEKGLSEIAESSALIPLTRSKQVSNSSYSLKYLSLNNSLKLGIKIDANGKLALYKEQTDSSFVEALNTAKANYDSGSSPRQKRKRKLDSPDSTPFNPYAILGVTNNASQHVIRKAYLIEMLKYHPDKNQDKTDQEKSICLAKTKILNQAYDILADEKTRNEYDEKQRAQRSSSQNVSSFFNEDTKAQAYKKPRDSQPYSQALSLNIKQYEDLINNLFTFTQEALERIHQQHSKITRICQEPRERNNIHLHFRSSQIYQEYQFFIRANLLISSNLSQFSPNNINSVASFLRQNPDIEPAVFSDAKDKLNHSQRSNSADLAKYRKLITPILDLTQKANQEALTHYHECEKNHSKLHPEVEQARTIYYLFEQAYSSTLAYIRQFNDFIENSVLSPISFPSFNKGTSFFTQNPEQRQPAYKFSEYTRSQQEHPSSSFSNRYDDDRYETPFGLRK